MDVIMDFMVSTGTLKPADRPMASDLLDGSILDFIANDPGLATTASGDQ
jgi:hypothetical protein